MDFQRYNYFHYHWSCSFCSIIHSSRKQCVVLSSGHSPPQTEDGFISSVCTYSWTGTYGGHRSIMTGLTGVNVNHQVTMVTQQARILEKLWQTAVYVFFLFCFVLFCFVLFCFVLFISVLFCSVLFCSVLFCSVLFCFVTFFHQQFYPLYFLLCCSLC